MINRLACVSEQTEKFTRHIERLLLNAKVEAVLDLYFDEYDRWENNDLNVITVYGARFRGDKAFAIFVIDLDKMTISHRSTNFTWVYDLTPTIREID